MDHINPVVPVLGWDSWEGYLDRMFAEESGWQRLCKDKCHKEKTLTENEQRYKNKVVGAKIKKVKASKKSKKRSRRR